jgi:hypothetical protein
MAPHRMRLVHLATLGAILAAAACGSGGPGGYDDGVHQRFVAACTRASSGRAAVCEAAYNCIKQRVPFADFKAADDAIRQGRPVDPRTAQVLVECVSQSTPHG